MRTTREGVAAKVGHDLLIEFPRWSGQLSLTAEDPTGAELTAEVDLGSFTIVEGTGGASPLDAGDKADITKTAMKLLDVDKNPTAIFTVDRVVPSGDASSGEIEGSLTLHGSSGRLRLDVTDSRDSSWRATGTLLQSAFGIKPYKAFLGALRLSDAIGIEVSIDLGRSTGSPPQ
ncbi:MAG: YceI family protein [Sporichthyaceae bacterium]